MGADPAFSDAAVESVARIERPAQLLHSCIEVPTDGAAISASLPGTTTVAEVVVDNVIAKPEGPLAPNTLNAFLGSGPNSWKT